LLELDPDEQPFESGQSRYMVVIGPEPEKFSAAEGGKKPELRPRTNESQFKSFTKIEERITLKFLTKGCRSAI